MNQAEILKLRNKGLSIFPVSNDTKTPLVKWARLQEELPTYEEVNEWFSTNNRSVGVAMGRVSGLWLLDFDFSKHPESLTWYKYNQSRLPRTWSETTKSNGLHLYFKWTPALEEKQTNTTGVLASGVDTKGQGGYAKMTPSEGYKWVNSPWITPLAVPPQWLVDSLPAKGTFAKKPLTNGIKPINWLGEMLAGLKDGNRNESFFRVASSLRARGYGESDIFELLKSKARELEFSDGELSTICASVGRYDAGRQETMGSASDVEAFLADIQVVEWIVPSIISQKSIGFVAGLPETGKTWIMIDLAVECAKGGGQWLGRFPCEKARVLFIDQERFKGETQRRFRAVIAAKGIEPKELKDQLYIKCGTTTRINLENSYQAFRKELEELRPNLVIVDSFATFHTVEENNRGEIQTVLERIKQLRNDFGCTFLFIDHENKGAFHAKDEEEQPSAFRMAGSIAKPAAAEMVLTVRRSDPSTSMVYHTKSTLASTVGAFQVVVKDVDRDKNKIEVRAF